MQMRGRSSQRMSEWWGVSLHQGPLEILVRQGPLCPFVLPETSDALEMSCPQACQAVSGLSALFLTPCGRAAPQYWTTRLFLLTTNTWQSASRGMNSGFPQVAPKLYLTSTICLYYLCLPSCFFICLQASSPADNVFGVGY